jgi:hypothetical protein
MELLIRERERESRGQGQSKGERDIERVCPYIRAQECKLVQQQRRPYQMMGNFIACWLVTAVVLHLGRRPYTDKQLLVRATALGKLLEG